MEEVDLDAGGVGVCERNFVSERVGFLLESGGI